MTLGRSKKAKRERLQRAFRFFLENAGYVAPPGRAVCALHLAKAEKEANRRGITFDWQYDEEGCSGCECGSKACACSSHSEHEILVCVARSRSGKVLASLCGICEPSSDYRRVVEAELAQESI